MTKARNGIRYPASYKQRAKFLRLKGRTHREIAKTLGVSPSIAHQWTKKIHITYQQKKAIEKRRNRHIMNTDERRVIAKRLAPYRLKYSNEDLLNRIRNFYMQHERIPLKREFNAWDIYMARFGSWNHAIQQAGFETNPVLFAKKFKASDGHSCDSFTEKIIDDWLTANQISHERNARYGNTRFTADFKIKDKIFIEFFGLAGIQKQYDINIKKKRILANKLKIVLVEIYPNDLYPINKLHALIPV